MKRLLAIILALVLMFAFVSCAVEATPEPEPEPPPAVEPEPAPEPESEPEDEPEDVEEPGEVEDEPVLAGDLPPLNIPDFEGQIAIVTNTIDQNEEEFRSAHALVELLGPSRVIHRTWPVQFAAEGEMMITILSELASNPNVGAIIINQAVVNTNAAIDAVREIRGDDIFIAVANPAEDPRDTYARVDLGLDINNPDLGEGFVAQAAAMGAETIVHYSFPRHMAVPALAARRDRIQAAAEAAGIAFHDLPTPDPMEEGGMAASQLFVSQDVGRQIEEFGTETVFFTTNCGQQIPLLQQVLAYGAMYVQPCCPSPFHAFPAALGLAATQREAMETFSTPEIIEMTRDAIIAADMQGRLSNWYLPASMANTTVAFLYAVEWLNGNVTTEVGQLDLDVLQRLFADYAEHILGERIYLELTPLTIGDESFSTIQVFLMPFLVY